jgi:prepilin-type N-terminal cleavage/methylation domain-containing protein
MRKLRGPQVAKEQGAGFTLVEVLIALAISGLILASIVAILSLLLNLPLPMSDELAALDNLRQAVQWISADARQAESFGAGTQPDYGTFTWVDRSVSPAITHSVRYYYSVADSALMREDTANGSDSSRMLSTYVAAYSDVSLQESAGIVNASLTMSVDSLRGIIAKSASFSVQRRPSAPTPVPTPPPMRLAWDDFESGGLSGGSGWLTDWLASGDYAVTTSGTAYQGSYHLRLRSSTGYARREVNLSGKTDVHIQFWAKADSFEGSKNAQLRVSSNGTTWSTVKTWVNGEDDNVYHYWDFDLSGYSLTGTFWIAFEANMGQTSDYFYVDDL